MVLMWKEKIPYISRIEITKNASSIALAIYLPICSQTLVAMIICINCASQCTFKILGSYTFEPKDQCLIYFQYFSFSRLFIGMHQFQVCHIALETDQHFPYQIYHHALQSYIHDLFVSQGQQMHHTCADLSNPLSFLPVHAGNFNCSVQTVAILSTAHMPIDNISTKYCFIMIYIKSRK